MDCCTQIQAKPCQCPAKTEAQNSASKVAAPVSQSYPTFKPFPSAAAAVEYLIDTYDPDHLGFGEFHDVYKEDFKSTSEHFAEDIIPTLKDCGFWDLVLEFIPNDPKAKTELKYYKKKGTLSKKHTPTLIEWLGNTDTRGFKKIYKMAKKMNLYPGNLSLAQYEAWVNGKLAKDPSVIIKNNMKNQIETLLKQKKKVASYGGTNHNDAEPHPADKNINFGQYFNDNYKYLEVDLVIPEIFTATPGMVFEEKELFSHHVPSSGVLLIRTSEKRFIILFPRSQEIKQETKPETKPETKAPKTSSLPLFYLNLSQKFRF